MFMLTLNAWISLSPEKNWHNHHMSGEEAEAEAMQQDKIDSTLKFMMLTALWVPSWIKFPAHQSYKMDNIFIL